MMVRSYLAFILLLPALALAACRDDDGPPETQPPVALDGTTQRAEATATADRGSTTEPTAPSATTTPSPQPSPSAAATRATSTSQPALEDVRATMSAVIPLPSPQPSPTMLSEAALRPALLTLDDLPSGWEVSSLDMLDVVEDAEANTVVFLCHELARLERVWVEIAFSRGELGPQLVHQIALYPLEDADKAFEKFREAAKQCAEVSVGLQGGARAILQLSTRPFPELGDEVLALRLTGRSIPLVGRPELDVIKIREGDAVITLAYFSLNGLDGEQTEALARRALEKLRDEVALHEEE